MVDPTETGAMVPIINLGFDSRTWAIVVEANGVLLAILIIIALAFAVFARRNLWWRVRQLDLDETELGIGSAKLKLKPNYTDRQVAYQVWVELSTRKIGLDIDLKDDVISEIYDSWHAFFGVTRELIKSVPVNKTTSESTRAIINLSIDVLNLGLRPHLTSWQARFRAWYDRQLRTESDDEPQAVQKRFPQYAELAKDLQRVNKQLIAYREAMHEIIYGSRSKAAEAIEAAAEVVDEAQQNA